MISIKVCSQIAKAAKYCWLTDREYKRFENGRRIEPSKSKRKESDDKIEKKDMKIKEQFEFDNSLEGKTLA